MSQSLIDLAGGVVTLRISVNGAPMDDDVIIERVETDARADTPSRAVLTFADGSIETSEFPLADGGDLRAGATVAIEAGYGAQPMQPLFAGAVTHLRQVVGDGDFRLLVHCQGDPGPASGIPAGSVPRAPDLTLTLGFDVLTIDLTEMPLPQGEMQDFLCAHGTVSHPGYGGVRIGHSVKLTGNGDRFAGTAHVRGVRHDLAAGRWTTTLALNTPQDP